MTLKKKSETTPQPPKKSQKTSSKKPALTTNADKIKNIIRCKTKTLFTAGDKKRDKDKKVNITVQIEFELTCSDWDYLIEHTVASMKHKMITNSGTDEYLYSDLMQIVPMKSISCQIK
jgi:hypothetical protein